MLSFLFMLHNGRMFMHICLHLDDVIIPESRPIEPIS